MASLTNERNEVRVKRRQFSSVEDLIEEASRLLAEHLQWKDRYPHGIMLSGGKTPLPIYNRVADRVDAISEQVYLFPSDERMVPMDSPESNIGNMLSRFPALEIPSKQLIHVHTELPLGQAAERFDLDLARFFENKGTIGLGFLGLGSDGHTASVFSKEDAERSAGHFAMPVAREGMDRVSVTPILLERIERIIFLVTGHDKKGIISEFTQSPMNYPAGHAVAGAKNVELWSA